MMMWIVHGFFLGVGLLLFVGVACLLVGMTTPVSREEEAKRRHERYMERVRRELDR